LRRLVTSASIGTPCTSNVIREPTSIPSWRAITSSTDTRGGPASAPHQRPRVSTLPGGGADAHVSTYSRV